MKTDTVLIPETTIEALAELHDLVMEVRERPVYAGHPERFTACFKNSEIQRAIFLCGVYGTGSTVEMAIRSYAEQIQFKKLVIDAAKPQRREIPVPRLKLDGSCLPLVCPTARFPR